MVRIAYNNEARILGKETTKDHHQEVRVLIEWAT